MHQRLQDNGGNTAALSIEECLQCVEGLPVSLDSDGNVKALENDAGERPPEDFHPTQRCDPQCLSMERAVERNKSSTFTAPAEAVSLQSHLHCQLDSRGAVVAVEYALEPRGSDLYELLGKKRCVLVRDTRK